MTNEQDWTQVQSENYLANLMAICGPPVVRE